MNYFYKERRNVRDGSKHCHETEGDSDQTPVPLWSATSTTGTKTSTKKLLNECCKLTNCN